MSIILDVTSPSTHHQEIEEGRSADIRFAPTDDSVIIDIRFVDRAHEANSVIVCEVVFHDSMRVPLKSVKLWSDGGNGVDAVTEISEQSSVVQFSPQEMLAVKTAELNFSFE
ncbi:hypothetical protein EDF58_1312 [Novosphingobium sp. PhB57]|jgi:hypothetical protein|uniref:hypothetical protein n=1 Tax=Novosphingobium sp. PhB57 TaxID=2485107 RepID=UPI001047F586|nr:hypothetical protein [Novosphingobium sp. PhB57]TCU49278.1 hypothetical protein EDF58_1312 [Novosphingobium sp. PhB57]